jgi:hypothetical protein
VRLLVNNNDHSYRSSLSSVNIDQFLSDLRPLDLEFSWKFQFSGHFLNINFADIEMKLFTIMGNRSSLSFVVIDKYLKSHGPRAY